ncbi:hypothetical protein BDZ89DRAFT_350192 [Hymenopellis radicata]|nr:hypothetical protein BDZ89DRAFT_350192 [Hymenopellis radicata]
MSTPRRSMFSSSELPLTDVDTQEGSATLGSATAAATSQEMIPTYVAANTSAQETRSGSDPESPQQATSRPDLSKRTSADPFNATHTVQSPVRSRVVSPLPQNVELQPVEGFLPTAFTTRYSESPSPLLTTMPSEYCFSSMTPPPSPFIPHNCKHRPRISPHLPISHKRLCSEYS